MSSEQLPELDELHWEAGGWIRCHVPQARVNVAPLSLLTMSQTPRVGNLRYGEDSGRAVLMGELRGGCGWLTATEAHDRFRLDSKETPATEEDLACALADTRQEWKPAENQPLQWQTIAFESGPQQARCALTTTVVAGGAEVRCRLLDFESDLKQTSLDAIARFLATAQQRIRFARFTLLDGHAAIASFASDARLDFELADSVAAVLAAHRLVEREVRALTRADLANAYLEVFGTA